MSVTFSSVLSFLLSTVAFLPWRDGINGLLGNATKRYTPSLLEIEFITGNIVK